MDPYIHFRRNIYIVKRIFAVAIVLIYKNFLGGEELLNFFERRINVMTYDHEIIDANYSHPSLDQTVGNTNPTPISVASVSAKTCAEIIAAMGEFKRTVRDCTKTENRGLYFRIENRLEWEDARDSCRHIENGDLASVHDFEEKMLINSLALNNYFNDFYEYDQRQGSWLGLHRKDKDCFKPMEWTDGSPVDYEDFIAGEPNCSGGYMPEHCVFAYRRVIKHSGVVAGWNDGECDERLKSICKVAPSGKH